MSADVIEFRHDHHSDQRPSHKRPAIAFAASTASLVSGVDSGCEYASGSQLDEAVNVLRARPGRNLTWFCQPPPLGPDPHPDTRGYGVVAEAFAVVLEV
jgi:hypothetical protein